MPDTSSKVKPLKKKAVANIFQLVSASYSRMHDEKKFKINALAIQLEKLLLSDSNGTTALNIQVVEYLWTLRCKSS